QPAPPKSPCNRPGVFRQSGLSRKPIVNVFLLVANLSLFVATAGADLASITNFTATRTTNGMTVQFFLANASNDVPYSLYKATSLTQEFWTYLGPAFASHPYTFSNQIASASWYRLSGPPVTMVVAWGDDPCGQTDVPVPMTNGVAL